MLDGAPVVVIATGVRRASENPKTGKMIQTWILRADVNPFSAIHNGQDVSVCGDCPLRGVLDRNVGGPYRSTNRMRSCYVNVTQAPLAIFQAFRRGRYTRFDASRHLSMFAGRTLRIGAYGDACAVPYGLWAKLVRVTNGHTGYTHSWRIRRFWRFRQLVMASVETLEQAQEAQSRGWRTFRAGFDHARPGELHCPASAERGHAVTCERCCSCDGHATGNKRRGVFIRAHGSPATLGSYRRMLTS
jgi:hypothetical protein